VISGQHVAVLTAMIYLVLRLFAVPMLFRNLVTLAPLEAHVLHPIRISLGATFALEEHVARLLVEVLDQAPEHLCRWFFKMADKPLTRFSLIHRTSGKVESTKFEGQKPMASSKSLATIVRQESLQRVHCY
jgi:hypothetical protein